MFYLMDQCFISVLACFFLLKITSMLISSKVKLILCTLLLRILSPNFSDIYLIQDKFVLFCVWSCLAFSIRINQITTITKIITNTVKYKSWLNSLWPLLKEMSLKKLKSNHKMWAIYIWKTSLPDRYSWKCHIENFWTWRDDCQAPLFLLSTQKHDTNSLR